VRGGSRDRFAELPHEAAPVGDVASKPSPEWRQSERTGGHAWEAARPEEYSRRSAASQTVSVLAYSRQPTSRPFLPAAPPLKMRGSRRGTNSNEPKRNASWCRRLTVPAACTPLYVQKVAQRLLVKARLWAPGLVFARRPEPRTVRCQDFVDQQYPALRIAPELEHRVGDDYASLKGKLASSLIHGTRQLFQFCGRSAPNYFLRARGGDILIVAGLGFRRRREQRPC